MTDEWVEWHRGYEPGRPLVERLKVVQERIREALDRAPPGPIRVLSACAGDGRDLLGALTDHPRAPDVRARLVERSSELASAARKRAADAGLVGVEVVEGDAAITDVYAGIAPAQLVLFCGVFGNVTDADVHFTVDHLPELCADGATVVWTRGRFAPDLTPAIRRWFADAGFSELSFVSIPGTTMAVGAHRLARSPVPFRSGVRLFTFLPYAERPSTRAKSRAGSTDPSAPG